MKAILLIALVSIVTIGSNSFAGPLVSASGNGRGGTRGVFVVFSSIGSGINQQAFVAYETAVLEAEKSGGVINTYFRQQGREGESVACVHLADPYITHVFINSIASVILQERPQITEVYVGADCSDISKASKQHLPSYP